MLDSSACIKLSNQRITKYNIHQQLPKNWILCNKNQKNKKKFARHNINELDSALRKLTLVLLKILSKKCFCFCSKHDFYFFILNKQSKIRHLSRKFDLFFNFIFESFKRKITVFTFPYLIYNGTNEPSWQSTVFVLRKPIRVICTILVYVISIR